MRTIDLACAKCGSKKGFVSRQTLVPITNRGGEPSLSVLAIACEACGAVHGFFSYKDVTDEMNAANGESIIEES